MVKGEKYHKELNRLLLEAAEKAGIEIIEDRLNRRGGTCRMDERLMVIYDSKASLAQRNRLILDALAQLNPEVFLPPRVRELLEEGSLYS